MMNRDELGLGVLSRELHLQSMTLSLSIYTNE